MDNILEKKQIGRPSGSAQDKPKQQIILNMRNPQNGDGVPNENSRQLVPVLRGLGDFFPMFSHAYEPLNSETGGHQPKRLGFQGSHLCDTFANPLNGGASLWERPFCCIADSWIPFPTALVWILVAPRGFHQAFPFLGPFLVSAECIPTFRQKTDSLFWVAFHPEK